MSEDWRDWYDDQCRNRADQWEHRNQWILERATDIDRRAGRIIGPLDDETARQRRVRIERMAASGAIREAIQMHAAAVRASRGSRGYA